ncbi:MAG: dockerin type I domain-containing protein [Bacteroidota bacterium]
MKPTAWTGMILAILLSLFSHSLEAQYIYPGDINDDGIVDGVDFLRLGQVYRAMGTPREQITTDFSPQAAPNRRWATDFSNGLNSYYADCNGDGYINYKDIKSAILGNFGKRHGKRHPGNRQSIQKSAQAVALAFLPDTDSISSGQQVNVEITLGDIALPVSDFYGLTFDVVFDATLIDWDELPDFFLPSFMWYAPTPSDKRHISIIDPNDPGRFTISITRIDQQSISGHGLIGRVTVVIEDIDGFRIVDDLYTIENVLLVDENGTSHPVVVQ